jgi:hypothetical protein
MSDVSQTPSLRILAERLIGQRLLMKIDTLHLAGVRVRGRTKQVIWHETANRELGAEFSALLKAGGLNDSDLELFYNGGDGVHLQLVCPSPLVLPESNI